MSFEEAKVPALRSQLSKELLSLGNLHLSLVLSSE